MRYHKIFGILILYAFFGPTAYALAPEQTQDTQTPPPETPSCRLIYDENQHLVIPQKGFVMLYFYNPRNEDSLKMREIVQKLQLKDTNPTCFQVDTSLSLGLKRTYQINDLPSLVILQDKKIIYGITGFLDDAQVLTQFLEEGIQKHKIVSPEK